MVHCMGGCGRDPPMDYPMIPIYKRDKWGYKTLRGYVCYTCYGEP